MMQNLKIDIIYYDTPSDFEFEFNLGGCCHSRVLNSRTSSPKEMIGCLSKAVSRSRVILIIGKLDGSDGLFSMISKAISLPLTKVNAEEYRIVAGTDTNIIANSLPLISTDGLLAGCIIESGPQSIILLPGAKSLRKDVAENLVFQYITAVSRTPDTETVATPDSTVEDTPTADDSEVQTVLMDKEETAVQEPIAEEQVIEEEVITEEPEVLLTEIPSENSDDEVIYEDSESITESPTEIVTEEKETEIHEDFIDLYTETAPKENSEEIDNNYVYNTYNADNSYGTDNDDDDYEEEKRSSGGINTFIWIIVGLMLIVVAALVYMLVYTPLSNDVDVIEYIGQVLNI